MTGSATEPQITSADAVSYAAHLHDVAVRLLERGDAADAMTVCRTSLVILVAEHGETHPAVATVLLTLGNIHHARGDGVAAARCYDRAEILTRALRLDDDARALLRVSALAHAAGLPGVSERLARDAAVVRDAVDAALREGDVRVQVAVTLYGLAAVLEERDAAPDARRIYSAAVPLFVAALPRGHAATVACQARLAALS